MRFEFTPEHDALRHMVRSFAEAEIGPHAARWDREHRFPTDVVKQMGDLGLFGLVFPEEWGGGGGDFVSLWAGQAAALATRDDAADVFAELAAGLPHGDRGHGA